MPASKLLHLCAVASMRFSSQPAADQTVIPFALSANRIDLFVDCLHAFLKDQGIALTRKKLRQFFDRNIDEVGIDFRTQCFAEFANDLDLKLYQLEQDGRKRFRPIAAMRKDMVVALRIVDIESSETNCRLAVRARERE